ncbi:MAG: GTPase Era [Anaeroplasmataceae bacterium]
MEQTNNEFKSGFVTLIGRPNVGKSTLLNQILGKKIAIMSDKPQTTRNRILGIYTTEKSQIIFTDTPGIHKPHHELGQRMVDISYNSIKGIDVIFFMVSAVDKIGVGEKMIIENLKNQKKPIYLIINKIDLLKNKLDLLAIIDSYKSELEFKEIFPVSAKENDNVDNLLANIENLLPEGPMFYPKDMISDHPERFIIAEMIREKLLILTKEEVPHSIAVTVDSMKEDKKTGKVEIFATIFIERDSQKRIIIGKDGSLIKIVKEKSRKDIKDFLGMGVTLDLWVKVKKDWTNRPDILKTLGYGKDNF